MSMPRPQSIAQKRKADAAGGLVSFGQGEGRVREAGGEKGKPAQFEGKAKERITMLLLDREPSPQTPV